MPSFEQLEVFENWLSVVGYECLYEVSDWGRIRSLSRIVKGKNGKPRNSPGKILILCKGPDGYPRVTLCKDACRGGRLVHRLVMEAFIGPCSVGKEVDHIDGDRENGVLPNLRYVTSRENNHAMFERVGWGHKLIRDQVLEIRRLNKEGMKRKELASLFHVSLTNISDIVRNKIWKEENILT